MALARTRWTAPVAALLLACGACQPSAPPASEAASPPPSSAGEPTPDGVKAASPPTQTPTPVQDRSAELEDLEAMCAALDHDYIDGTLSDYYADIEPATSWGEEVKKAGDAADQPGRHLEGEATSLVEDSGLELPAACTKLFDVLDDLE